MINIGRRHFLKGATTLGGASLLSTLPAMPAFAADTSGYKAMVCLFLRGGVDCHDLLLPYDQTSHDRYMTVRETMIGGYGTLANSDFSVSRERSNLTELNAVNNADFGSRRFALAPELAGIRALFEAGDAAVVANVGPLIEPVTRETFENGQASVPKRLFSHNDQQSTWSALAPEGARYGWGGRFSDVMLQANANQEPIFTVMSTSGHDVFLAGEMAQPYQIGLNGPVQHSMIENRWLLGTGNDSSRAAAILREHYSGGVAQRANYFERDIATAYERGLRASTLFQDAYDQNDRLTTEFPTSNLGNQLRAIAETLNLRGPLQANRQVFIASQGGFDTHDSQAGSLPATLATVDAAVTAFYQALSEMGLTNDVILFTASDFGRTLSVNGDGTDHGWGGHHLVIGGAVNGRTIYGAPPPYDLDHDLDADQGRLIPTTSVEQYAGTIGRWFGLNTDELVTTMPNYATFGTTSMGFV